MYIYDIQNIYADKASVSIFGTKTTIFCNLEFFAPSDCVCSYSCFGRLKKIIMVHKTYKNMS